MVKIRLKRMGAHKKPFYRIVVADSRNARNGRFIEEIGYYNPLTEPATIKIEGERAEYWLSQGAQPTDVVRSLLKKSGVTGEKKAAKAEAAVEEARAAYDALTDDQKKLVVLGDRIKLNADEAAWLAAKTKEI